MKLSHTLRNREIHFPESEAFAVSADGSVVVGTSWSVGGDEAFRWTAGSGMVGLGDLPGGIARSSANGISADGSVIVGEGQIQLMKVDLAVGAVHAEDQVEGRLGRVHGSPFILDD